MEILGLTGIQAVLVIVGIGVPLQNIVGWLKNSTAFNLRNAAASGIIAFVVGITIIGPSIEAIPDDITDVAKLTLFAAMIASIAGFDALAKNSFKAASKAISKKE